MPHTIIGRENHGLPAFNSASYKNPENLLMQLHSDNMRVAYPNMTVAADLEIYSVVNVDMVTGAVSAAVKGTKQANAILTTGYKIGTHTVEVYLEGHYNMNRLIWDASYVTDADKKAAFVNGDNLGTIYTSAAKHSSENLTF